MVGKAAKRAIVRAPKSSETSATRAREPAALVISKRIEEDIVLGRRQPRERLVEALTGPVRWRETLLTLQAQGVSTIIDVGPGKILTGLAKRTLTDMELVNA